MNYDQTEDWLGAQEAEQKIKLELAPNEKLLWSGKPKQGIVLRGTDFFLIPFSLMWGGFAIFWEIIVFKTNAPFFFRLCGIPFVLLGLYLIIGRFFADASQRRKIIYGLTNQRVIIISGLLSRQVKTLNLKTLSDTFLSEKSDGSGTINFGRVNPRYMWINTGWWPGLNRLAVPNFDLIKNVKEVYEKIRRAQNEAEKT